MFPGQMF